jgi:capsular exopolysaccharide synthesis family protein
MMNSVRTENENHSADDEIDLREYWSVINRRKWGILGLALAVSLLSMLIVNSMQPIFQSTATILIEPPKKNAASLEEVYGLERVGSEYFKTQVQILSSRELAVKVIDKLNLLEHPAFSSENNQGLQSRLRSYLPIPQPEPVVVSPEEKKKQIIRQFLGNLSVSDVRHTHLAKVSYESIDPVLAADIANSIAGAYIESGFEARLVVQEQSADWLTERLVPLKEALAASEQRLQAFREKEGLVDLAGVRTLVAKELNEITVDYIEAKTHRSQMDNALSQVSNTTDWLSVPAVLNNPVIQRQLELRSQVQKKISDYSKRYGPEHPKMIAANSELSSTENNLRSHLKNVIASVKKDRKIALDNERALASNLERAKEKVQSINRKEYKLRELEREVDSNRKLYDIFFTRFQETDATRDFDPINVRITEKAIPSASAAKPRKRLIVALAFMASMMFGVMLAFFLEFINSSIRKPDDVRRVLGVPLLGVVPLLKVAKDDRLSPVSMFSLDDYRGAAESFRGIRTALRLLQEKHHRRIILVTSSVPGEGKTTVSSSVAYAFGQLDKVLFIDADLRKPAASRLFGLSTKRRGLTNILAGEGDIKACFHKVKDSNLTVLPSGYIPANPAEVLSRERFQKLIKKLSTYYKYIIIDSPPVNAVSDALVISKLVDEVVYVVKADSTPQKVVKQGMSKLSHFDAENVGVVLNQFDVKKADYYEYYYAHEYYGETKE